MTPIEEYMHDVLLYASTHSMGDLGEMIEALASGEQRSLLSHAQWVVDNVNKGIPLITAAARHAHWSDKYYKDLKHPETWEKFLEGP